MSNDMIKVAMAVSSTEGTGDNRTRKEIGKVAIYVPPLTLIAQAIVNAKVTGTDPTDGMPIYDTQEANWVADSIYNAVKMAARNKLENKSITLKEGLKIAATFEELTEPGQRGSNGEGLAILREVKSAFSDWVTTLGKSEATQTFIVTMFSNRQALATQKQDVKTKMAKYVEDFALSLSEEQVDRFNRPLEAITASCATPSTVEEAQDF